MCDTMVALGNATADGSVLFAKNSDREANEAHEIIGLPAADYQEGERVDCTYLSIPQATHTYAVMLAKPYWIWGAEMGANEHGVVIGNEAVFSRIPAGKEPGLIGMDYLRLGLERGATAREALDVIVQLLRQHGQSGNCGHTHGLYYHNSFLIADFHEAWVLETVDRMWVAERVRDVRSISNGYTIHKHWDLASEDVVGFAVRKGWCRSEEDFDFAACYADTIFTRFSFSSARQCRSMKLLEDSLGSLREEHLMAILRDHGDDGGEDWSPKRGLANVTICWHAGPGPIRDSQSVGSMVSRLTAKEQTHWITGTSAPCTGIFKPLWLDCGLPDMGESPGSVYTGDSLWWRHETMHREVLRDFPTRIALIVDERDVLEQSFLTRARALEGSPTGARGALSRESFKEAQRLYSELQPAVASAPLKGRLPMLYALAWQGFNRKAGLSDRERVRKAIRRRRKDGLIPGFGDGSGRQED